MTPTVKPAVSGISEQKIRAALLPSTPWLDVFCLGCGTSSAIDLRTADRHPLASVGTLVLGLRRLVPMPKLVGLFALPPALKRGLACLARWRGRSGGFLARKTRSRLAPVQLQEACNAVEWALDDWATAAKEGEA